MLELRDDVKFDTLDLLGDPEVAAKHLELQSVCHAVYETCYSLPRSSTGEGLFTTGIIGFSFANLGEVTPRASEIIKAAEDKIMKNANSYPPGLLEQYKISLERLKNGVGCEFISFPGLNSRPSRS